MREKHLIRTSKILLLVHVIATFFMFMGLMSQLTMAADMKPIASIVPMIATILALVSALVVRKVAKTQVDYIRFVSVAMSVVYFLIVVMGYSNTTYPYLIPFLMLYTLSLDDIALNISVGVFAVTNVIRIIETLTTAEDVAASLEYVMIEAIIAILAVVVSLTGIRLLRKFLAESIEEVTQAAEKNEAVAKQIAKVAENVRTDAEGMSEDMESIAESAGLLNEAMNNIMIGTQNTAEAITTQTMQTQDIQEIIDDTNQKTETAVEITESVTAALKEGVEVMDSLTGKVAEARKSNEQMREAAGALKQNTEDVRGITDIILGISNKTNLLALNASIEAARAGEAGKGFAVVADEIRNLAAQTKTETENITAIIDSLGANADKVGECVENSAKSSEAESEYAANASGQFRSIREMIDNLDTEIEGISKRMSELLRANNDIVDSVSTLSATSEEISASASEATTTSDKNVVMVKNFAAALDKIMQEIVELNEYTQGE